MLRIVVALFGSFLLACGTAATAQQAAPAGLMAETGRWSLKVQGALEISHRAYEGNSPEIGAAMASLKSPADAEAVAARLKAVVPRLRAALAQSNAALDAIGAPPPEVAALFRSRGLGAEQIVADAKAQNTSLDRLYGVVEQLATALAAGDMKRLATLAPRLMEGGVAMIDNRAMLMRNRQLLAPPADSAFHALGIEHALYVGMSATLRAAIGVKTNPGAKVNVEPIRTGLNTLATDIGRISMNGRTALDRDAAELRSLQTLVDRGGTPEQKTVFARAAAVMAAQRETFAVGDRLAALTRSNAALMTQPQLAAASIKALIGPYEAIENDLADIHRRQAEALAGQ